MARVWTWVSVRPVLRLVHTLIPGFGEARAGRPQQGHRKTQRRRHLVDGAHSRPSLLSGSTEGFAASLLRPHGHARGPAHHSGAVLEPNEDPIARRVEGHRPAARDEDP